MIILPPFRPIAMLISAFVFGLLSAYFAYKREHNPYLWFLLGFCFGIFGIFAIFFLPKKKMANAPEPTPEPVLSIQGPIDKFWYYLGPTQQQQGPMSRDALTAAWKNGEINPSTLVWNEEMTEWKPLQELIKPVY